MRDAAAWAGSRSAPPPGAAAQEPAWAGRPTRGSPVLSCDVRLPRRVSTVSKVWTVLLIPLPINTPVARPDVFKNYQITSSVFFLNAQTDRASNPGVASVVSSVHWEWEGCPPHGVVSSGRTERHRRHGVVNYH